MVPEAEFEDTGAGLIPKTVGWFALDVRKARWSDKPEQGWSVSLTGRDEYEAETFFPMLGMALRVARAGEVTTTYHWETEQEDFLVLAGECIAIIEGRSGGSVGGISSTARLGRSTRSLVLATSRACCSARAHVSSRRTGRGATTAMTRRRRDTTPRLPRIRRTGRSRTPGSPIRVRRTIPAACCPNSGKQNQEPRRSPASASLRLTRVVP